MSTELVLPVCAEVIHPDIKWIWLFPDAKTAAGAAASEIISLVAENPGAVISYATGETMVPVYEELVKKSEERGVSFADTLAFQGDDYYPADPDRDGFSFAHYLRKRLFEPLGIPTERRFEINALAEDPETEAARYEALLRQYGPVDLTILGVGPDAHIYFNESGTPFNQRMFVANFSATTLFRDRVERGQATPDGAITQGIGNILDSRQILLVAFGANKGEWLRRALYGEIGPECPASALRLVGDKVTMVIDQEAAAVLQQSGEER